MLFSRAGSQPELWAHTANKLLQPCYWHNEELFLITSSAALCRSVCILPDLRFLRQPSEQALPQGKLSSDSTRTTHRSSYLGGQSSGSLELSQAPQQLSECQCCGDAPWTRDPSIAWHEPVEIHRAYETIQLSVYDHCTGLSTTGTTAHAVRRYAPVHPSNRF